MTKEKFLIIAEPIHEDCFGRFSETENCATIDAGAMNENDAYSWIEASFEIRLVRYREATHICSFTPSARYTWLQNAFIGIPNSKWNYDGDPEGLERENGGEIGGYGTYSDEYDPRFICDTFTVDTVKVLGIRKPPAKRGDALDEYHEEIWRVAEEAAFEIIANGGVDAPILDVWTYRQWRRECLLRARAVACRSPNSFF